MFVEPLLYQYPPNYLDTMRIIQQQPEIHSQEKNENPVNYQNYGYKPSVMVPLFSHPQMQPMLQYSYPPTQNMHQININKAVQFLKVVEERFKNQPESFQKFLSIMKKLRNGEIITTDAIRIISKLFEGKTDLIARFNEFIPQTSQIPLNNNIEQGIPNHLSDLLKKITAKFPQNQFVFLKFMEIIRNTELLNNQDIIEKVSKLFAGHPDLIEEFKRFTQNEYNSKSTSKRNEDSRNNEISRKHKNQSPAKGKSSYRQRRKVDENDLSSDSESVLEKDNQNGDNDYGNNFESKRRKKAKSNKAKNSPFSQNSQDSTENLETSSDFSDDESDDESDEQNNQQPNAVNRNQVLDVKLENLDDISQIAKKFLKKIKRNVPSFIYEQFLKCLDLYTKNILPKTAMETIAKDLFVEYPQFFTEFQEILFPQESEYEDVDYDLFESSGSSYKALPLIPQSLKCSARQELEKSVLNNKWVSIPIGSEDHSAYSTDQNQHERIILQCEEERFEMGMLIELNLRTLRSLEELKCQSDQVHITKFKQSVEQFILDPLHSKTLNLCYGETSKKILELLQKEPYNTVDILLKRLKLRDLKLKKEKKMMDLHWKKITDTHFFDSKEFQFNEFQMNEKNNLSYESNY
eukprot:Anaeramoba_ignava/c20483_g1_i1.p1 GENE.c20483_g1_i1~~c20483_g1_i1.p1  ORF type:complete len:640 (+),score=181.22 c20483_g1_i1:24-1922(+)